MNPKILPPFALTFTIFASFQFALCYFPLSAEISRNFLLLVGRAFLSATQRELTKDIDNVSGEMSYFMTCIKISLRYLCCRGKKGA